MKEESCLVPCTGLYADIADNSLKQTLQDFEQNVAKGKMLMHFLPFHPCLNTFLSGIYMLTDVLLEGVLWDYGQHGNRQRLYVDLRQMFLISADKDVAVVKSLTESYHKYKRQYAKHLSFKPYNTKNLSEYFLTCQ